MVRPRGGGTPLSRDMGRSLRFGRL